MQIARPLLNIVILIILFGVLQKGNGAGVATTISTRFFIFNGHFLNFVSDDLIRLLFSSTVVLKTKYCYTNDLRRGLLTSFVRKIVCLENDAEWPASSILSWQDYTFIITMTSLLFYLQFFYVF